MTYRTQPLREEHKQLLPHIEYIREAADLVGDAPPEAFARTLDDVHTFIVHHLMPHARAEERVLYPAVERALHAAGATATMIRDHREIERLSDELGELRWQVGTRPVVDHEAKSLRRVLYGLYALIRLHFVKEEEVLLPVLDEMLTADEAIRLFEDMAAAA
jgi:hemerythrin-like domain-containing protein